MSAHTKIVVLRSKELLYTILLLLVGILIVLVLLSIFLPSKNESSDSSAEALYVPGIYSTAMQLGNASVQLQVTVDANHINGIELINLDDAITTMYPLMEPCLEELSTKILDAQSVDNISYSSESKYTSLMLLNAISQSLDKAAISTEPIPDHMQ